MYLLLVISLIFALFFVINLTISLAASLIWRCTGKFARLLSGKEKSNLIFGLRIFPLAFAALLICVFLIPSYFLFEPHDSDENVGFKLAVLAIISAAGMLLAARRIFATFYVTHRTVSEWLLRSEPLSVENISAPVYKLEHPFPVIAVVGVLRPKMFIASQVFEVLSKNELAAAIAHERGHLDGSDNFKRMVLRVCRDLLIFPIGRKLEVLWTETTEESADEFAAGNGSLIALDLASALIKISKIIPPEAAPKMPLAAFLIEENNSQVVRRIINLTNIADQNICHKFSNIFSNTLKAMAGVSVFLLLSLATNYNFLSKFHLIVEKIVAVLQ